MKERRAERGRYGGAVGQMVAGLALYAAGTGLMAAPQQIFTGGPILTLDPDNRIVEALAVEDGRISALGSRASVQALADAATVLIDLEGAALLPGFVDSHSHAGLIGLQALSANLLPAPDGEGGSVADLQRLLRTYAAAEPRLLGDLGWIIGFGYDDSQLAERRHPTRQELDAVSTDVPIVIIHQSGHLGVGNTAALAAAGIDATTPDPDGGVFQREADGRTPNGVAEEYAFFNLLFAALARQDEALQDDMLKAGVALMASFGYTTAQDGRSDAGGLATMARVAARGELPIDVVAYPDTLMVQDVSPSPAYRGRFRVGGVKLTIDGSPQGKTAWLGTPYYRPPPGRDADYAGYPAIDRDTINASLLRAWANGWQVLVHANGDAAIDAMIDGVRAARSRYPQVANRPVLIHGQTLRRDQVPQLRELAIFPSLFPMHTFYWGDWHRESVLGPERADNISPTGWVLEHGMRFGTHHDAPVALPDSMRVLYATVTRRTRSMDILGPEHRVDVTTALRAMTIWPAWQHFEEDEKGSLEVGKLADLVVLSANPLAVEESALADLEVLATYKEGQIVFMAPEAGGAASAATGAP